MAGNVQDITLEILKKFQAEFAQHRSETRDRLDRMDELLRKVRRDYAGMLVMMRAVTGDFDQRVSDIEERVAALESSETPPAMR
jgi:uncharacterized protein YukE